MKCALGVLPNRLENDLAETRTGRVAFARALCEQGALREDCFASANHEAPLHYTHKAVFVVTISAT